MNNSENKFNDVRQMTDAELRRALDFLVGDVVLLNAYKAGPTGVIEDIKLSHKRKFLIYVVRIELAGGPMLIQAQGNQMIFIKHGDE